jgi:hypothetical protein
VVIGFEAQPVMARAKKIVMIGFILFLGWWALPYGLIAAKRVRSVQIGLLVGAPQVWFRGQASIRNSWVSQKGP